MKAVLLNTVIFCAVALSSASNKLSSTLLAHTPQVNRIIGFLADPKPLQAIRSNSPVRRLSVVERLNERYAVTLSKCRIPSTLVVASVQLGKLLEASLVLAGADAVILQWQHNAVLLLFCVHSTHLKSVNLAQKNPFQCRAWQRGEVDEPRQVMPSLSSGLNITALTGPLQKQCAHGQSLALYFAAMTQIFVSAVWLDEAKTFLAIPIADLTVGISWPTMRTLQ